MTETDFLNQYRGRCGCVNLKDRYCHCETCEALIEIWARWVCWAQPLAESIDKRGHYRPPTMYSKDMRFPGDGT